MATRDEVREHLRAEDVANHLGIRGIWRGRWLRARRCGRTDHASDAFGLARDGMWHCWACDEGGDLLKLVAIGEGLDVAADFPKVLEVAAELAGLVAEDDFGGGKPAPRPRPAPPPLVPIEERIALARKRARWVWDRMGARDVRGGRLLADAYLERERRLPIDVLRTREDYRDTPMRVSSAELARAGGAAAEELLKLARMFAVPGVAVPVRAPTDGAIVDVRIRRFEPATRADGTMQPKIIGMLGGVSSTTHEGNRGRELLGCYGFPHEITSDTVIVVEGLVDYLTALCMWPDADVLGAVESGSISLVARHAATALAAAGDLGRLLIVEHGDGWGRAGDRAVNEEANAAAKVAIRALGPRRIGWMFCDAKADGRDLKDLNDAWRAGVNLEVKWWAELGEAVA